MHKLNKLGFVSIELIITAAVIIGAGLLGITSMGVNGGRTMSTVNNKLDNIGIFDGDIIPPDPNIEEGLRYQWSDSLSGWEITEHVDKTMTTIYIPTRRGDNRPVVSIAADVFKNAGLTSLTLPGELINIGAGAFESNLLTSVIIPNSVINIEELSFSKNNLTSLLIPSSVRSVGYAAFAENQLSSVIINEGLTHIGDYAFVNNQITSVILPNSLTHIGEHSFSYNMIDVTNGFPLSAYQVPWNENATYIIYKNSNNETMAFTTGTTSLVWRHQTYNNAYGFQDGSTKIRLYKLSSENTWDSQSIFSISTYMTYGQLPNVNTKYNTPNLNATTILYTNSNIYKDANTLVLQQSPFQLSTPPIPNGVIEPPTNVFDFQFERWNWVIIQD